MKHFKLLTLILVMLVFNACNSDDDNLKPTLPLQITLQNAGSTTGVEGVEQEIIYQIILSESQNQNIELIFDVNDTAKGQQLFTFDNPVVIQKGQNKGVLKIKTIAKKDAENSLTEDANFQIILKSISGTDKKLKLDKTYSFVIKPDEGFTPLTSAQKELLAYYKTQGLDLTPFIGKIPVITHVKTDKNGNYFPFDTEANLTYNGITYITLSDKATKEKPLLSMTKNAFGLSEYLQYVFRSRTIENDQFWRQQPSPMTVLNALGEERVKRWENKEYTFDVSVEDLLVKKDHSIEIVKENNAYEIGTDFMNPDRVKTLASINFTYNFPLWNELVEIAKKDDEVKNAILGGGSVHPNNYIGYSFIDKDDWGEGNWVEPKGSINNSTMTFQFNVDNDASGGYDKISVEYTSPY